MTTRTIAARVALAALIVTLMAACSSETPPADSPPPADATVVAVSAIDFGFELSEEPSAAGTYTFELTNNGSMGHNLVLEGVSGASTAIINAGDTDSFTVTLEPGEYTLYCSVGNHRAQGMEVSFTIS